ncbi:heme A synthase [Pueribacillus theae]|uniref:Heme A synthase n=1 Tax=Pueribacillus theae TaxID=2171751 RepID=A0A2U1K770_9BACI|nr:heme A synthase [Pueribacillus theae]PWA13377.1 heme A synthase [Pueribacillus theae]
MNKLLKVYAAVTTLGMFVILLMGAIVTTTDSGDGCGNSWPLCYGKLLPTQPEVETIIEYSHRVVSGLLGIMVIMLAIWTWKKLGHLRETKWLAFFSVFLIAFQGLLGAAAVIWGQSSAVLALHFGISLLSLASVFLLTLLVFEDDRLGKEYVVEMPKTFRTQLYVFAIFLYIAIYSGAFVRHTKASLACSSWPVCGATEWIPPLNSLAGVHFIHRILAFVVFIWLLYMFIRAAKEFKNEKVIFYSFLFAFLFVIFQVFSGALIIFSKLNLFITLAHGFFISCLFVVISYLLLIATRQKLLQHEK